MRLCRFCNSPAEIAVELERGCYCFPDDRNQDLCMQHWIRLEPLGKAVAVTIAAGPSMGV